MIKNFNFPPFKKEEIFVSYKNNNSYNNQFFASMILISQPIEKIRRTIYRGVPGLFCQSV